MGWEAGYLATVPSMAGAVPKMLAAGDPHQATNGNLGTGIQSALVQIAERFGCAIRIDAPKVA